MVYGSETWAMTAEQSGRLERTEMRMVRQMCDVLLRERMGIESLFDTMRWNRLRLLGHVLQKDDDDWVKKIMLFEVVLKERMGKAEDDMEPGGGKGHNTVQVEKGRCKG